MAHIIKPPQPLSIGSGKPIVFLAGSIEMGRAKQWQREVEQAFPTKDVIILNPRRDDWDSSWVQSIDNPDFREQVEWELTGQELATVIAMYFAPETHAPVTLLELGLHARSGKVIVCCPQGFWRRGNVEIVCARYRIPMVQSLVDLLDAVRQRI
ncbi:MAG: nucleoside 2-deoxyribosyltransferase domain-containing protein, partial [Acidobacteria bacterium]|nr:nucleoside 2-deoxyribosyltransferase domain-containing protein [Acidobacteriota bacterium]